MVTRASHSQHYFRAFTALDTDGILVGLQSHRQRVDYRMVRSAGVAFCPASSNSCCIEVSMKRRNTVPARAR